METTIQISEVNSKDVNTSRGVGTVYNVKAVDGKEFSTFKKDLGQQAGQLRGQWATVEYQEVQKGKYTNYYLDSVSPYSGDTKPAEGLTDAPGATSTVQANKPDPAFQIAAQGVSHNITYKDDKSAQINRSVAFKAAVKLVVAGFVEIAEVEDLDKLTSKLIPIVEGTYTPFVPAKSNPSSGDAEAISDGILVDF